MSKHKAVRLLQALMGEAEIEIGHGVYAFDLERCHLCEKSVRFPIAGEGKPYTVWIPLSVSVGGFVKLAERWEEDKLVPYKENKQ